MNLSIDLDGDHVNSQRGGIIVSPHPSRTDLRKVQSSVIESWLVNCTLRPGDVVFDVGAGIGDGTMVFAKNVGRSGHVFAFEANPSTARCLSKTVQQNRLESVTVIAAAVTDKEGYVAIADGSAPDQNSLILPDGDPKVEVPALTLDAFADSMGVDRIELLKMNIEGAEVPALRGFERNFGCVSNVAIACHDWIADLGYSDAFRTREYVSGFLESHGFVLSRRLEDQRPWIRDILLGSRRG